MPSKVRLRWADGDFKILYDEHGWTRAVIWLENSSFYMGLWNANGTWDVSAPRENLRKLKAELVRKVRESWDAD